jgi:hypothetical protein
MTDVQARPTMRTENVLLRKQGKQDQFFEAPYFHPLEKSRAGESLKSGHQKIYVRKGEQSEPKPKSVPFEKQ